MEWNQNRFRTIIIVILLGLIFIGVGCIENTQSDLKTEQTDSPTLLTSTTQFLSQNQTVTTPVTIVTIITPHFTDTIPANFGNSSIITKEQAWNFAVPYFERHGFTNIQASEVESIGPKELNPSKSRELIYSFSISCRPYNYNQTTHRDGDHGGIIWIDAHDGHFIDYVGVC